MSKSDQIQKKLAVETHSEQAELFAERYSTIVDDPYANCFRYSRYQLDRWLDRVIPQDGTGLKMLDLGCGTGYHMANYRRRGFEMTGVDGSAEMLKEARQINPEIEFHQSDVTDVPLESGQFDFVVSIEVIRYLPQPKAYISEIERLLKPGGVAVVTAAPPLQANLYPLVNLATSTFKIGSLTNLRQFFHGAGRLRRDFGAAGFSDIKIHGVYGGSLVWLERVLPKIVPTLIKVWEPFDNETSDAPILRNFSNMLMAVAKKPAQP